MSASKPSGSFKFRKNSTIGAAAAEDDHHFLENCYIDTGDLGVLTDTTNPKRIVVGRTGSGKTALLTKLAESQPNVIEISPFNLAVDFVSNSRIIRLFTETGVNMDPFFKLLWRHVFTVELIKKLHGITDRKSQSIFFSLMMKSWSDEKKEQYQFLLNHGDSFWKETDERVQETTKKTEKELSAALDNILGSGADLNASYKYTDEQRTKLRSLGQEVVSKVKIKDLNRMFDLLREEMAEGATPPYFIVIDDLDQGWADDSIRYRLIHALIEEIREFQKIKSVKIIICLRTDLIERVMRQIKGPGYQEEKLKSLFLYLSWSENQLAELLDARINQLVRDSYTLASITHRDLLPNMGKPSGKDSALRYMLDRTMMRPRDLISFFNICIEKAIDRPNITKSLLMAAEGDYSIGRRRSLEQEWQADYPDLTDYIDFFKKRPPQFHLGELSRDDLFEFAYRIVTRRLNPESPLGRLAFDYANGAILDSQFRISIALLLYSIGFLGIKTESYTKLQFVGANNRNIQKDDITENSLCCIHKMYWRALGMHAGGGM